MNTDNSFTREEANLLRVAAAFVTIHHHSQSNKRRRSNNQNTNDPMIPPLLPSRPTTTIPCTTHDHIQYILTTMTQRETVGSSRWKSLAHHLAHQLMQWDQCRAFLQSAQQQYDICKELLQIRPSFFAPLLVPLLWPQRTNGHAWELLELALAHAPLATVEETVQELIAVPPLPDNLAAYYLSVSSSGSDLLSKWAQDHLLQQLLERLHEAERAPKRG